MVVQLVHGLDIVVANVIAGDEVVDQVGIEGVGDLALGKSHLHALGQNSIPEIHDRPLCRVERNLRERRHFIGVGGRDDWHAEVEEF